MGFNIERMVAQDQAKLCSWMDENIPEEITKSLHELPLDAHISDIVINIFERHGIKKADNTARGGAESKGSTLEGGESDLETPPNAA